MGRYTESVVYDNNIALINNLIRLHMESVYIVYLNKTYDVWAMDAHTWAEKNSLPTDNIISEVVFWHYMEEGLLEGKPVYFCKDIQQECLEHHLALNGWKETYKSL